MSAVAEERDARAPWALTAPALMLFVGVLLIPLAMTVMLSFHDWGQYKGIEPVFILKNWHEIVTDPYYAEMFWRTFRIAILTTLLTAVFGAPERATDHVEQAVTCAIEMQRARAARNEANRARGWPPGTGLRWSTRRARSTRATVVRSRWSC